MHDNESRVHVNGRTRRDIESTPQKHLSSHGKGATGAVRREVKCIRGIAVTGRRGLIRRLGVALDAKTAPHARPSGRVSREFSAQSWFTNMKAKKKTRYDNRNSQAATTRFLARERIKKWVRLQPWLSPQNLRSQGAYNKTQNASGTPRPQEGSFAHGEKSKARTTRQQKNGRTRPTQQKATGMQHQKRTLHTYAMRK